MSKFAKKQDNATNEEPPAFLKRKPGADEAAKAVVSKDSKLEIMKKSSEKEKKEIAKREAAKKGNKPKALKQAEKTINKALKKAAANSAFDEQKIKVLKKDHGARAGSNRAKKWDALVSSKTIGEARGKQSSVDAGSVAAAVKAGVISLS